MSNVSLKRTSLYASGSSPVNLLQARFYHEDCLVYDLEDSVPLAEKDAARLLVYNLIKYQRPADKYIIIRVNGIYSEYIDEDLEAAVRCRPDAIRIPKVEYASEVKRVAARITEIEKKAGLPEGGIELWCNIESYLGALNAREIADYLDLPLSKVEEIMKLSQEPISLETPVGEEDDSHLGDFIQDSEVSEPMEAATANSLREQLEKALAMLTPREEKVLRLRFGFEDGKTHTLEEVGKEFNVTRERVRQIESKALRRLRHPSKSKALRDFVN